MNATGEPGTAAFRTSDWYAAHARRASIAAAAVGLAIAVATATAVVFTQGESGVLVPLVGVLVVVAVLRHPPVGVYLLFGAAVLFEQFEIGAIEPITFQVHFFQNLSEFTDLPLRLSLADLLILLTLASWLARRARRHQALSWGPLGGAVALYGAAFGVGLVIGVARGGEWDANAALAELRGPAYLCVLYFMAANLIRERIGVDVLAWTFVALITVKAVQGILNFQEITNGPYAFEALLNHAPATGDEDVVFFNFAVALLAVLILLGVQPKLKYALLALSPFILTAEVFGQRRGGFVALGVVLLAMAVLFAMANPRRGLVIAGFGALALGAYVVVFWDQGGLLGEPIRALRVIVEPSSLSVRDLASNQWREIENRNIAYSIEQLPLTGVGVGQKLIFHEQPPALPPSFTYWRYITHNAVLWVWLKAGPLGAMALWYLIARVLLLCSGWYMRLDAKRRWAAALPVALVVDQIVFSSVDLGLSYSRSMIALGTLLGLTALVAAQASPDLVLDARSSPREARARSAAMPEGSV